VIGWVLVEGGDVPVDDQWMTGTEREALADRLIEKRRRDWRLGRWAAKCAVGAALGLPVERVEIISAGDGAPEPFLERLPLPGLRLPVGVSLSHSRERALAAVARPLVRAGCDLEAVEHRADAFAREWFTEPEVELVEAASPAERDEKVTMIWSAKESALKAAREGLRRDTRSVVVAESVDRCDGWSGLNVWDAEEGRRLRGWWRSQEGMVLTIVAEPYEWEPIALMRPLHGATAA